MGFTLYDIIIIGSGMAGLYSAYNIEKLSPNTKFLILEKNSKKFLGGRANTDTFYSTNVVTGAGIGRKDKDKLLLDLVKKLNIKFSEFTVDPKYSSLIKRVDINKIMNILKVKYNHDKNKFKEKSQTFSQFAKSILGTELYKQFLISSGYTDYENEDIEETLYYYGMEDNACCWKSFGFNWADLTSSLYKSIGEEHFKFNSMVTKITKIKLHPIIYSVETATGAKYFTKKIIIAGTIQTIRTLLPNYPIYKEIESQPFLRLYGKFSTNSIPIMKKTVPGYMFLPGLLQKIIPMNADKGVYMIAYNDNANTLKLSNHLANTESNRQLFSKLVEASLGLSPNTLQLIAIKDYYWQIGTHYYKPLNRKKYNTREEFINLAQHPTNGILVVGEVVSRNQGWVEGALESVDAVLTKKWIETNFS